MTRVLFVCLGNICRSPMAHGIMGHLAERRGLSARVEVDSAGTAANHTGAPPDPRTVATLTRHGIALVHRARQVTDEDFDTFDLILGMDASNLRDLRRRCPAARAHVVRPALEPVGGGDVADPYYGGPQGFDVNYDQLSAACEGWLDRIAAGSVVRPPVE